MKSILKIVALAVLLVVSWKVLPIQTRDSITRAIDELFNALHQFIQWLLR